MLNVGQAIVRDKKQRSELDMAPDLKMLLVIGGGGGVLI